MQQASNLNDPDEGEGLEQVFLMTRIYPGTESNFFINLGVGYVGHWNKRPGEANRKHGFGVTVGGGYDVVFDNKWAITPFISYSLGETGDEDYKALTLGAGFSVAF